MRQRLISSAAFGILVGLLAWPACAALESGVYQSLPGATVEERGRRKIYQTAEMFNLIPKAILVKVKFPEKYAWPNPDKLWI